MSPKELLYIDDALSHEKCLMCQCQQALSSLKDPELKSCVQQLQSTHQQLFSSLLNLV